MSNASQPEIGNCRNCAHPVRRPTRANPRCPNCGLRFFIFDEQTALPLKYISVIISAWIIAAIAKHTWPGAPWDSVFLGAVLLIAVAGGISGWLPIPRGSVLVTTSVMAVAAVAIATIGYLAFPQVSWDLIAIVSLIPLGAAAVFYEGRLR